MPAPRVSLLTAAGLACTLVSPACDFFPEMPPLPPPPAQAPVAPPNSRISAIGAQGNISRRPLQALPRMHGTTPIGPLGDGIAVHITAGGGELDSVFVNDKRLFSWGGQGHRPERDLAIPGAGGGV